VLPAPVRLPAVALDRDAPAPLLTARAAAASRASELVIFLVKLIPPLSLGCVALKMPRVVPAVG